MPWRIPARVVAVIVALGFAASSRADQAVDLNNAMAAAGQQTRAVVARLNDLHGSHGSGAPNGGVRTERLRLAVDNRAVPVPLSVFARFMPGLLKESRSGPVGSFLSGSARVVHKTGRQARTAKLETPG